MLLIGDPGHKMPERTFKILAYVGRVPMMASCPGANRNFLSHATLSEVIPLELRNIYVRSMFGMNVHEHQGLFPLVRAMCGKLTKALG
jgi:hypothetical protein